MSLISATTLSNSKQYFQHTPMWRSQRHSVPPQKMSLITKFQKPLPMECNITCWIKYRKSSNMLCYIPLSCQCILCYFTSQGGDEGSYKMYLGVLKCTWGVKKQFFRCIFQIVISSVISSVMFWSWIKLVYILAYLLPHLYLKPVYQMF